MNKYIYVDIYTHSYVKKFFPFLFLFLDIFCHT